MQLLCDLSDDEESLIDSDEESESEDSYGPAERTSGKRSPVRQLPVQMHGAAEPAGGNGTQTMKNSNSVQLRRSVRAIRKPVRFSEKVFLTVEIGNCCAVIETAEIELHEI